MFLAFVVLGFVSSSLTRRSADKNNSKMTSLCQVGREILINQQAVADGIQALEQLIYIGLSSPYQ